MTTRILITDASGFPLAMLDGNHGAAHAERWTADVCTQLRAQGIEPMVFELTPSEGGDAFRVDVAQQLGRLRPEFRKRPHGARELVGFHRLTAARSRAAVAMPEPVRCSHRLVQAPADVHGQRQPIRVPRGRQNPTAGAPRTAAEARLQRRQQRAIERGNA